MSNQDYYGSGAPPSQHDGSGEHYQSYRGDYNQTQHYGQHGGGHSPYPQSGSPYPHADQGYSGPPSHDFGQQSQQYGPGHGEHNQLVPQPDNYRQGSYDHRDNSPYPSQQQNHYGRYEGSDQQYEPNLDGPEGATGERGLGKALLGAVGGGAIGHQFGQGALGAIGGALAANLIGGHSEEKKKKKKKKHHKHHRDDDYSENGSSHHSHHGHHHSSHGGSHQSSYGGSQNSGYSTFAAAPGGFFGSREVQQEHSNHRNHGEHRRHRSKKGSSSDSSSSGESD